MLAPRRRNAEPFKCSSQIARKDAGLQTVLTGIHCRNSFAQIPLWDIELNLS
jgi:hypothetical protein